MKQGARSREQEEKLGFFSLLASLLLPASKGV